MMSAPDLETTATTVSLNTPAKVNLTLAVLGKRADGFHEIESLVIPIPLYDQVCLVKSTCNGMQLTCDDPALPVGPENLVWRAADTLARYVGRSPDVHIRLTKRIPAGAGLGGGSSDAAATLIGLNRLWGLDLGKTELVGLAAALGSDVPLFLDRCPVIIRGRGEQIELVGLDWSGWLVLVLPPFGMSTAQVYRRWRPDGVPPPSADEVVRAYRAGAALDGLLFNMLEGPAFSIEPRLAELHAGMVELGAPYARMSGSGSALFALFQERRQAESFASRAVNRLEATVVVLPCEERHQELFPGDGKGS
jgi:4-diphosphocytidyl-2-C-methyl-D-erythritol kinase